MRNLDALLEEAKWSKLTDEELAYVVQRIKESKPGSDEDLYTLLHILGKSGAVQYRKLVESFLHYPTFPMISKIALQTLCSYWHYTEDYLELIESFIKGVEWDVDGQVRIIAISSAGEFLILHPSKTLLQLLVDIFEKEPNREQQLWVSDHYERKALTEKKIITLL